MVIFTRPLQLSCDALPEKYRNKISNQNELKFKNIRLVQKIRSECSSVKEILSELEMWANAQRDGRPAEHRWRPLFNAAKFG